MEKETIEEALNSEIKLVHDVVRNKDFDLGFKTGGIIGAKWQQERMYSEANKIMKFLDTEKELKFSDAKTIERIKWYYETYFEQFKNK